MTKKKQILAIIPARGGSKGVLRKNIRPLGHKPLIAWTIEAAKKSKYISELIVSSEDDEIIEVAARFGAKVPFKRPEDLARDDTPGIESIKHAVNFYLDRNMTFDYVVCLQCTSPFRTNDDIDTAIEYCINSGCDSVVSVCECEHNPHWMVKVENDGCIEPYVDNLGSYVCRQDLPKVYRLNGAIYVAKPELILKSGSWYNQNSKAFIMNSERSLDIDTMSNFNLAEIMISNHSHELT